MNRRLQKIYDLIPKTGMGIIDVGTDHGHIPIQLALNQYPGRIFASDIVPGPLNSAMNLAKQNHVEENIRFLLCDGLTSCPNDQVDTILIAGMGGDTICRILDQADWLINGIYRLILQPMTHAEVLRYWLIHNEFRIEKEALIKDGSHLYQIMQASSGLSRSLTDCEYLIGRFSALHEGESVVLLIEQQIERLEKKISGMRSSSEQNSSAYRFYLHIIEELYEAKTNSLLN